MAVPAARPLVLDRQDDDQAVSTGECHSGGDPVEVGQGVERVRRVETPLADLEPDGIGPPGQGFLHGPLVDPPGRPCRPALRGRVDEAHHGEPHGHERRAVAQEAITGHPHTAGRRRLGLTGEVHERAARRRGTSVNRHLPADEGGLRLDHDGRVVRRLARERAVGGGQPGQLNRRYQRESQPGGSQHALPSGDNGQIGS